MYVKLLLSDLLFVRVESSLQLLLTANCLLAISVTMSCIAAAGTSCFCV
jgi:hypothetical protein